MLQTIARMLGWAPRSARSAAPPIDEMVAAPPPGLAVVQGGDLGMPAPLELEALRARNRARAALVSQRNQSVVDG
jgi:hypothetical protein